MRCVPGCRISCYPCPFPLLTPQDDIEKYLGPSLQRHAGCDLVDLFPGAGLWSQKLHDMVKPRRHILLEPDEALYAPFLESLASKPGATIIPKSGLVWKDLREVLASLPEQTPRDTNSAPPERNDTLLVTANLSFYPKTKTTALYLFQLISAIRAGTLFQKHGLVRMLIWARPEDIRTTILPSAVQLRGRPAVEAELACEWIDEVVGPDGQDEALQASVYRSKKSGGPRHHALELQSAYRALQRLRERGVTIPKGRETEFLKEARRIRATPEVLAERVLVPGAALPYGNELGELERGYKEGEFKRGSAEYKRLLTLRHRQTSDTKQAGSFVELLRGYSTLRQLRQDGAPAEEIQAAEKAWNDKVDGLNPHALSTFRLVRDNLHLFRQEPPALLWDRRNLEPLAVRPREFFPNVGCSLLDIQPRTPGAAVRGDSEGARVLDLLIKVMLRNSMVGVSERLDDVWPDAAGGVMEGCPSLRDPARGGGGERGHAEVCVRALNAGQWEDIVEAWLKWPFRPGVERLVRQHEDIDDLEGGEGESDFVL